MKLQETVGRKWEDVDRLDLNWHGFWPVVDEDGIVRELVAACDGETGLAERGIVYDRQADVYRYYTGDLPPVPDDATCDSCAEAGESHVPATTRSKNPQYRGYNLCETCAAEYDGRG